MTKKIIAVLLFFASFFSFAEVLSSPQFGYTIDFPEGFDMIDGTEDGTSYLFKHALIDITTFIRVWSESEFSDSKSALEGTMKKLSAKTGDSSEFVWRNQKSSLSNFTMQNAAYKDSQSGWALSVPLKDKKAILVLAAFSESKKSYDVEQMIFSILDSLIIDEGGFRDIGAVTTFAFPRSSPKNITLSISGKKINTTIDAIDIEASQFVIDREFAVFKVLATTPFWKEAWQRFYRLVAKDAFSRMKKVSFSIYSEFIAEAEEKDSENPSAYIAQQLLYWVQDFEYKRVSASADKADFTSLPAILEGQGSDCDSRSMLLAVLLNNMNINSAIFISNEYSHAILGVDLPGKQGQTIKIDDTEFLVGETTAKNITLGMLQSDMQDRAKWIPVEFF